MIQSRISRNIVTTYLGNRAGNNVLDGQIRRGDGSKTAAVVWYSDLREFNRFGGSLPHSDYIDLLNDYFMTTAQPIVDHGGEILDFIGDAVLGIFPFQHEDELGRNCRQCQ